MDNTNKAVRPAMWGKLLKLILASKVGIPWKIAAGVMVILLAYVTGSLDGLMQLLITIG